MLEEEAIDLHLIAMSSQPPIFYWSPGTVAVLRAVRELRQEGLSAWATMDAGANVHVICDADSEDDVAERLEDLPAVGFVIRDGIGDGPDARDAAPVLGVRAQRRPRQARRQPDHRQGAAGDAAPRGDRAPGRGDRPRAAGVPGRLDRRPRQRLLRPRRRPAAPASRGASAPPISSPASRSTQERAAALHRIVIAALAAAGALPFSIAPSSCVVSAAGRPAAFAAEPLLLALEHGLLPVLYGDVVTDRDWGVSICSTERLFDLLARSLRSSGVPVRRALWLGETDGL